MKLKTTKMALHPSIHFFLLIWHRVAAGILNVPLLGKALQLLLGDPKTFQVYPGSPPSWTWLEKLHVEAPRRHSNLMAQPTVSFRCEGAVSLLPAPSGSLSSLPLL